MNATMEKEWQYHKIQYDAPYQSTIAFADWLESELGTARFSGGRSILDIGCGAGATDYYLAKRFPGLNICGMDYRPDFVQWGNQHLKDKNVLNAHLEVSDLYQLPTRYINAFDGIISLQTLSWLEDFHLPLTNMMALQPSWIALTSLFYEGEITVHAQVTDYTRQTDDGSPLTAPYNVYAMPKVRELFAQGGYRQFRYIPFEIGIDLQRPADTGLGTYTVQTKENKRLQFSGPVFMSWYFVLAEKTD